MGARDSTTLQCQIYRQGAIGLSGMEDPGDRLRDVTYKYSDFVFKMMQGTVCALI